MDSEIPRLCAVLVGHTFVFTVRHMGLLNMFFLGIKQNRKSLTQIDQSITCSLLSGFPQSKVMQEASL